MLRDDGSDDELISSTQECTSTSQSQNQGVSSTGELERNSYLSFRAFHTALGKKLNINNSISLLCPTHLFLLQLCQETCLMQRLHNQSNTTPVLKLNTASVLPEITSSIHFVVSVNPPIAYRLL